MFDKNMALLMDENARTIGVRFDTSGKVYTFATYDKDFQVGDYAVVESFYKDFGLDIARVERVDDVPDIDLNARYEIRWIVQRINYQAFQAHEFFMSQAAERIRDYRIKQQRQQAREQLKEVLGLPEDASLEKLVSNER